MLFILSALRPLVIFIIVMWSLMILGCWMLVTIVAPISIECCGDYDPQVSSIVKAAITLVLVVLWILILSLMKKAILNRSIRNSGR